MNWDVQLVYINIMVVKFVYIPYTHNKIWLVKLASADSLVTIQKMYFTINNGFICICFCFAYYL